MIIAICMGMVVFLFKGFIGRIIKGIYIIVIRDVGVFVDVNLN